MALYTIYYPTHVFKKLPEQFPAIVRANHCLIFGGEPTSVAVFEADHVVQYLGGPDIRIVGVLNHDYTPQQQDRLLIGILEALNRPGLYKTRPRMITASIHLEVGRKSGPKL